MREAESTLDLDLDEERDREGTRPVVRIVLASAVGFTRDGGSPTLSQACSTTAQLTREVERLEAELAGLRERGRAALEGGPEESAGSPATPAPVAPPAAADEARAVKLAPGLRVRDVMTRDVRTLGRNDPVSLADELMRVGRFRHAVVLDDDGGVAGVLSHRDIFHGALAWTLGLGKRAHDQALASKPVKEVMQTQVLTVASEDPLEEAARRMMEQKVGCLPVIDGDTLVGILTEGDFLALLAESHADA